MISSIYVRHLCATSLERQEAACRVPDRGEFLIYVVEVDTKQQQKKHSVVFYHCRHH